MDSQWLSRAPAGPNGNYHNNNPGNALDLSLSLGVSNNDGIHQSNPAQFHLQGPTFTSLLEGIIGCPNNSEELNTQETMEINLQKVATAKNGNVRHAILDLFGMAVGDNTNANNCQEPNPERNEYGIAKETCGGGCSTQYGMQNGDSSSGMIPSEVALEGSDTLRLDQYGLFNEGIVMPGKNTSGLGNTEVAPPRINQYRPGNKGDVRRINFLGMVNEENRNRDKYERWDGRMNKYGMFDDENTTKMNRHEMAGAGGGVNHGLTIQGNPMANIGDQGAQNCNTSQTPWSQGVMFNEMAGAGDGEKYGLTIQGNPMANIEDQGAQNCNTSQTPRSQKVMFNEMAGAGGGVNHGLTVQGNPMVNAQGAQSCNTSQTPWSQGVMFNDKNATKMNRYEMDGASGRVNHGQTIQGNSMANIGAQRSNTSKTPRSQGVMFSDENATKMNRYEMVGAGGMVNHGLTIQGNSMANIGAQGAQSSNTSQIPWSQTVMFSDENATKMNRSEVAGAGGRMNRGLTIQGNRMANIGAQGAQSQTPWSKAVMFNDENATKMNHYEMAGAGGKVNHGLNIQENPMANIGAQGAQNCNTSQTPWSQGLTLESQNHQMNPGNGQIQQASLMMGVPPNLNSYNSFNNGSTGLSSAPTMNQYTLVESSSRRVHGEARGFSGTNRRGGRRRCSGPYYDPNKRCTNCDSNDTPMWRKGPFGPKTLCNACGIKYRKEVDRRMARDAVNASYG